MPKTINTNEYQSDLNTQENPMSETVVGPSKNKKGKSFKFVLIAVILGAIVGGFLYYRYTKTDSYKQKKADKESVELVKEVGSMIILPAGKPAIFTVQDPDLLAGQQAFFKGAEKGDSLLVYSESGKAIIYSKKRHLIVNVGPVTFDQPKDQKASNSVPPATIKPIEVKPKN
jgi:hypothetical protein